MAAEAAETAAGLARKPVPNTIGQLKDKIVELTVKPNDGKVYVRVEELKAWMSTPGFMRELLRQGWYRRNSQQNDPRNFATDTTEHDVGGLFIVIAILFATDHPDAGRCIEHFKTHGLTDVKLPIPKDHITTLYQHKNVRRLFSDKTELERLASEFVDKQWAFCPIRLCLRMHPTLEEKRVVPICRKKAIKAGGSGKVWRIDVQEEFVDESLRVEVASEPLNYHIDKDYGPVSNFYSLRQLF